MLSLTKELERMGYVAGELGWNDDRDVYEMFIEPDNDLKKDILIHNPFINEVRPVKIGRDLVYSSDFQKARIIGEKIFKYDIPPFTVSNPI